LFAGTIRADERSRLIRVGNLTSLTLGLQLTLGIFHARRLSEATAVAATGRLSGPLELAEEDAAYRCTARSLLLNDRSLNTAGLFEREPPCNIHFVTLIRWCLIYHLACSKRTIHYYANCKRRSFKVTTKYRRWTIRAHRDGPNNYPEMV